MLQSLATSLIHLTRLFEISLKLFCCLGSGRLEWRSPLERFTNLAGWQRAVNPMFCFFGVSKILAIKKAYRVL